MEQVVSQWLAAAIQRLETELARERTGAKSGAR